MTLTATGARRRRPPRAWTASLLAACLLAACATPQPPAAVPADAPAQWYAPLPHHGQVADLSQWWRQFDDPLLVQLIDAAQAASPTLAQARTRIEQARATRVAAGAASMPSLDGTLSASRGLTDPSLPIATVFQAGLQTQWEIDLFGGLAAGRDAAQARLEGAQAGWHEARVSVAAETANQYFSRRSCERLLAVAQSDADSRAETARLAGLSAKAGFEAPANAALARASSAEGAMRLTQQQAQCELDLKALVAMSALPEPELRARLAATAPAASATTAASAPVSAALPTAAIVPAVPARLLEQRPDVYTAAREVAAASAEVGAAEAQRYPRLTLSGSIAAGQYRALGLNQTFDTWSIGPLALSLPLLDGGQRAANETLAKTRYAEAAATYRARVRQAVREVEEALVNLQSSAARSDNAQVATEGYRASYTAVEARYRGGLGSLLELEDARRTALAAESALVNLQRERAAAFVALYRAVGGGWTPDAAVPAADTTADTTTTAARP